MSDILTKEQEAQQAQTIGQIRGKLNRAIGKFSDLLSVEMLSDIEKLLEIVDFQAQKIAEQKAELNVTTTMLNDMNELCAEQAKEIERIKREFEGFKDGVGWRPPEPEQTTDSKEVAR